MTARFRLSDYDCIGFDMDHTLCRYHLGPFLDMEYRVLADYLVEELGYSAKLRQPPSSTWPDLAFKGLLLDADKGNLLKVDAEGRILRASHGTRRLDAAETAAAYGPERSSDVLRRLCRDPIDDADRRLLRPFRDYFDLPAAAICARIVDLLDSENGPPTTGYSFWPDVHEGLVEMFSRENLALNVGGFYPAMRLRPRRYLRTCSPAVKEWLQNMRRRQAVYLVSGSDADYVNLVAGFCLGREWRSYFDFIVCGAKKPSFWSGQRPFTQVNFEGVTSQPPLQVDAERPLKVQHLHPDSVYCGGNWRHLKSSMAYYLNVERPRCLYVGDHLVQDVTAARQWGGVETVAVVEELGAQLGRHPDASHLNSAQWGSFFDDAEEPLWSSLIRRHSRVAVADVETLAQFPLNHRFHGDACTPLIRNSSVDGKFLGFLPPPSTDDREEEKAPKKATKSNRTRF